MKLLTSQFILLLLTTNIHFWGMEKKTAFFGELESEKKKCNFKALFNKARDEMLFSLFDQK